MTSSSKQGADSFPQPQDLPLQILDGLFEGCQLLDFDLKYLYLNPKAAEHARYPREKLVGRRMVEVYPGIEETEMFGNLQRCLEERRPIAMENRFQYEDGLERVFELHMAPVPQGVFILSMDVTDRQESEARLRKSESMLARAELIAGMGNWHWVMGKDEVTWSSGLFRILALNPEKGAPPFAEQHEIYHPDDWDTLVEAVERAAKEGRHYVVPARMRRSDGVYRHCIIRGYPESGSGGEVQELYGVVQDITDLLALQEQVEQRHRLESIGSLAGGVAHDFNNILMAQMGFCDLVMEDPDLSLDALENVQEIRACAERAAALTRQLLAFSRRQTLKPLNMDLNKVVRDMEPLLRRLIGEDIHLEIVLSRQPARILADPSQMEQILMNLVVNSRDAMRGGGRLTIETSHVELDDDYVAEHEGSTPGAHAMLAVSDSGVGMSEETRLRLFDPFFTTKERGQGTGMGMAMVYGIVKQSGGNIWVYSEEGSGTSIKVYLPSLQSQPDSAPARKRDQVAGHGESLLVVEDDANVAQLLVTGLKRMGYQVHTADCGPAALELVEKEGLQPDLLITDVVMPGMGGGELANRLKEMLPSLQILFMSGYTENVIVHQGVLDEGVTFLQKPFNFVDLAEVVGGLLDERES